jgi:hypothetical protein
MQEKLQAAMDKSGVKPLDSFIWRGHKILNSDGTYSQNEKRLVDMSEGELIVCYEHCKTMLFNQDIQNPGRYNVLEVITDQKERLGVELFIRYVSQKISMSRFTLVESINTFLKNNKEVLKNYKPIVSHMFTSVPDEFQNISLNSIIDGCLDKLGTFNKKHITRALILKQGIWLTPTEAKELSEVHDIKDSIKKLEIIRENLSIKPVEKLSLNSKGLNYTQMRALLNIKPNKKYSELTTMQLETLRNRILFTLEDTVQGHIKAWEKRMEEIELVADSKEYKL